MIYFDNNATTQILAEVREAMLPFLDDAYGNPSSVHEIGNRSRVAIEKARGQLARAIGANASEIIFTGCGSEATNHALVGSLLRHMGEQGKNLIISQVEHPATRETAEWLAQRFGFELRIAPIKLTDSGIDPAPFIELMDENTVLVSVMWANNETGLLLPVGEIFAAAKGFGAVCHCDGVQALGKVPMNPKQLSIDLMSLSAHKLHGPKGIGALFVRRGIKLEPLIHGGPQESARRAGTENVAYIVGFGKAAEIAATYDTAPISEVRDYFESQLTRRWGDRVRINFQDLTRTPNTSSVTFPKQDGNVMLIKLDRKGVCVSTGAACSSGSLNPSKGLMAMGLKEKEAAATLRFSFSRYNTKEEVDQAIEALAQFYK